MNWSSLSNVQCLTKNDIRENVRNYIVLEFITDVPTTRLQVPEEDRKLNLLISYNTDDNSITEKYIGPDLSDDNWISNDNWSILSESGPGGGTGSYKAIDLGLPSGRKWASMNIGATSETEYGQYFQWGDVIGYGGNTGDGKQFSWSSYKYGTSSSNLTKYNSSDRLTTLQSDDDAAVINMGGNWRMPDIADFNEILNSSNCTNSWVSNYNGSGISGRLFTSVRNNNTIFFPAAGYRSGSGLSGLGSSGGYWSRSLGSSVGRGQYLSFDSGGIGVYNDLRYNGFSVRGVL